MHSCYDMWYLFIVYSLSRRYKISNTYLERSFGAVKASSDEKPVDSGTVSKLPILSSCFVCTSDV